jgi:DNA-binding NtrC family response regulator
MLPDTALERWQLGLVALGSGVLWWLTFSLMRRLSQRAIWSTSGLLSDGARDARDRLVGGAALEELAAGTLVPLAKALGEAPELYALEPPLRIRLDSGERINLRSGDPPAALVRALFDGDHRRVLDLVPLRAKMVREPAVRELVDAMEANRIGCVLPCLHLDHVEGLLLLPVGDRTDPLSPTELEDLGRLGDALGGALTSALAQRRADTHIHDLSALRRQAEDRISVLEGEVEQLRGQCDVLGRGLSEDQTLHVAYSATMRRVQTRAIELAPLTDPVLIVAPAGSPVLPVSRFIHDRGPRWEAPFIVADCSAAPADEVTRLLFGSVDGDRGGWIESATGGTLLLRDLPALSLPVQSRLGSWLSASSSRDAKVPFTARLIATSRAPFSELQRRGALDPELARCFSGAGLTIPSLRQRREDVPSLVLLAIDRSCRVLARAPLGISQEAMATLVDHDWPGDVAELELVVELATTRASGRTITPPDLPPLAWPASDDRESLSGTYLEVERRLLERALLRSGGNKSEAARMLGLKRTTFLDKLRRHGLEHGVPHDVSGSAVG